jgi:hydrogenase nickel incorporation protein HypA/HybF
MGIVVEVYRTCREAVREYGAVRLERVKLAVGELAAVEPDLLSFAWEAVTVDGPDEGSILEIDFRPARQTCTTCNADTDRSEGSWLRLCPTCGMPLVVQGGDELDVLEVSFLTDDEEAE